MTDHPSDMSMRHHMAYLHIQIICIFVNMRRPLLLLIVFLCTSLSAQVFNPNLYNPTYSRLTASNHPRILLDTPSFDSLIVKLANDSSDGILTTLSNAIVANADELIQSCRVPMHKYDASNRRILSESRFALSRIFSCAYSFRLTNDPKYLSQAEEDILTVCSFPDWNAHKHFLDTGEMSAAVGIGYDWLYDFLSENTKRLAEQKLLEYAFEPSADEHLAAFYQMNNNWNSVCNAGLVVGALAVYETCDTTARRIIEDAAYTNRKPMEVAYSPDGNYAEGPGYWSYGTMFETLMLSSLESCLGTDFGLGEIPGFLSTGRYMLHVTGIGKLDFNYYDNPSREAPAIPMWYFAAKTNDTSLLHNELVMLRDGHYAGYDACRLLPMVMAWASKMDLDKIALPDSHLFIGCGKTPVALVREDWTGTETDRFLGIKGGSAATSHAHMDAGSFVYDAFGVRWSMDMDRQSYQKVENPLKELGGSYWDMHQNSLRWRLFRLNNRQHSTLTINDMDHNVKGEATLIQTFDTDASRGALFDMSPVFEGEAAQVTRMATLKRRDVLEIRDYIVALDDKDAVVRFTLVTPAKPTISSNGILLRQNGYAMLLSTSDTQAQYKIWSSDPNDYESPCKHVDEIMPGVYICGFETTVPKGMSATFITSFQPVSVF